MKSRLILIFIGLVFFFNPNFYMFDILPDFVGAVLIMTALSAFVYFDGNFETAHKSAKYLLWFSILKTALCMWCMGGHRDYIMPFTFIFAVLETIFMISMFRSLYLGAEYTLMRSGSDRTPKAVNEAFTMSFIFTIASRLLEFIPQIADIAAQDAELDLSHKASFKMPMAQLKMYLLGACLVCGVILGIIYLVMTAKAWIGLACDQKYNSFVKEKYENFLKEEREVFVTRRLSLAYLLITVSVLFIPDFYVDAVNLIPSVVTVILSFSAAVVVNKLMGKRTGVLLVLSGLTVTLITALYMSRVRLGINYICSVETFNRQEFTLLESTTSVVYSGVMCLAEAIIVFLSINYALSCFKKCFMAEKRKNVLGRITICRILTVLSLTALAFSRVLTCVCGHLSSHPPVTEYVKNKAFITSGVVYQQMMANEFILRYEKFVSLQSAMSLVSLLMVLLLALVLVNMKRATEGNDKEMG